MRSLFLAWQAPDDATPSRAWFPVGRLDAEPESHRYRFLYTQGARRAEKEVGFTPLLAFPEFDKNYESKELFPLFENRVISPNRKDFEQYVHWLDLDQGKADPIDILSISGGERATDNLEVFPKVSADDEGNFKVKFFLHGLRHISKKRFN